jgi:hypothetical protein
MENAPEQSLEEKVLEAMDIEMGGKQTEQAEGEPEASKGTQPVETSEGEQDTKIAEGGTEAAKDDSTAKKEENRVGYQLRQLRGNDEFIRQSRSNLDTWVKEAETPEDARLRKLEANQVLGDIERSRAQLRTDGEAVSQEIAIFNSNSADFNQQLYNRAMQRYSRDQLVTENDAGGTPQIISYKTPLLEYMREEAESYYAAVDAASKQKSASDEKKQVDKKTKQANLKDVAEEPGAVSPESTKPQKNGFDEQFEQGFNSYK